MCCYCPACILRNQISLIFATYLLPLRDCLVKIPIFVACPDDGLSSHQSLGIPLGQQ